MWPQSQRYLVPDPFKKEFANSDSKQYISFYS